MAKVLVVFGTRPEAIKMAPLITALKGSGLETKVCVFRQHKETLDQMLKSFGIKPDYDLPVSLSDKAIFSSEVGILRKGVNLLKSGFGLLKFIQILRKKKPDLVLVQGDTSTAMLVALIASNLKINVGHVEAGLRTYDKWNPFPEEMNRKIISAVADLHFAPTEIAKENLLREGISAERIFLTGNTVIDAIQVALKNVKENKNYWNQYFRNKFGLEFGDKKLILVTAHRRENFDEGIKNICEGLKKIANSSPEVLIVYPVHPNPNIHTPVYKFLSSIPNIKLLPPLDYHPFVALMDRAYILLTDSGGLQEEASKLGKPVLIMRQATERPEALKGGNARVLGVNSEVISREVKRLLEDETEYKKLAKSHDLFGDGRAAERIVKAIETYLLPK